MNKAKQVGRSQITSWSFGFRKPYKINGRTFYRRAIVGNKQIQDFDELWRQLKRMARAGRFSAVRKRRSQNQLTIECYGMEWVIKWGPAFLAVRSPSAMTGAYNHDAIEAWRKRRGLPAADERLRELDVLSGDVLK